MKAPDASITSDGYRAQALAQVAGVAAQAGELSQALEVAQSITSDGYRAQALARVADVAARAGELEQALELVAQSWVAGGSPFYAWEALMTADLAEGKEILSRRFPIPDRRWWLWVGGGQLSRTSGNRPWGGVS